MDWVKFVIPLIAVAVWILSNMAKNREEPRRTGKPPPLPPRDDASGPRRRPRSPSEVDKFLEEVRRRREAGETRKRKGAEEEILTAQVVEAQPPRPARPVPPPLPVAMPVPQAPPKAPQPRPVRTEFPEPPAPKKAEIPQELKRDSASGAETVKEALRVYGFESAEEIQIFQKGPDGTVREISAEEIRERFVIKRREPGSRAAAATPARALSGNPILETLALLKNSQTLATAIVLREILEAPVSRRTDDAPAHRKILTV